MNATRSFRFRPALLAGAAVALVCMAFARQTPAARPGSAQGKMALAAGVDRVVVLGGKTYLVGKLKAADKKGSPPAPVTWSKASGPGKVAFADARALATTATFSATGDYVLKLTAGKGPLSSSSAWRSRWFRRRPRGTST